MTVETRLNEESVDHASEKLYAALTHHFGPLDLGAHDPLVLAIAEYGKQCRKQDEEEIRIASRKVYEALTHHFGPRDLGASDPVVKALAEYGRACREAGR